MDRDVVLARVLELVADQRCGEAALFLEGRRELSPCFVSALGSFVAFMACRHSVATELAWDAVAQLPADPAEALLAQAAVALAGTADPSIDEASHASLPTRVAAVADTADRPLAAFGRYVAVEAAVSSGRLPLALDLFRAGSPPQDAWEGNAFAPIMVACEAQIAAFAGNISRALELLAAAPSGGKAGVVITATRALTVGHAADAAAMRSLLAEAEASDVPPIDRIGRGIKLLLAFGADALGDTTTAARNLLEAGGGAHLANLLLIERGFGFELLIAAAAADEDLEAAQAWLQQARELSGQRASAPSVARSECRVALLAGDPVAAKEAALRSIEYAARDGRATEQARAELLLAQAQIAAAELPDAARGLRDAVLVGDRTGHLSVRRAATLVLRPTRRRLPPITGSGRPALSPRECQVVDLIAVGADNAQIAASLFVSEPTVRTHVTRILTAYGVATRTALLAELHEAPEVVRPSAELTPRQAQVAELVAQGLRNSQIAEGLAISPKSVDTHIAAIRDRWCADSRFDIALHWWDLQLGLGRG